MHMKYNPKLNLLERKPKISNEVIYRKEFFGGLVFKKDIAYIFEINKMGYILFKLINGKNTISNIINKLNKLYNKEKLSKIEIIEYLKKLDKIGVIKW